MAFSAQTFDVIVGHVHGCPIYIDLRQHTAHQSPKMLLDVAEDSAELVVRRRDSVTVGAKGC